jgi:hypothetical protein
MRCVMAGLQFTAQLESSPPRHHYVHQDHVRGMLFDHGACLVCGLCIPNFMPFGLKNLLQQLPGGLFIVHDKNSTRPIFLSFDKFRFHFNNLFFCIHIATSFGEHNTANGT